MIFSRMYNIYRGNKGKVLQCQNEYTGQLFHRVGREKPAMHKSMEGCMIVKSEGKTALDQMKSKKAEGPDQVIIDMLILGSLRDRKILLEKCTEL